MRKENGGSGEEEEKEIHGALSRECLGDDRRGSEDRCRRRVALTVRGASAGGPSPPTCGLVLGEVALLGEEGIGQRPDPRAALPASRAGAPLRLQAEGSLPSRGRALALPIPTSGLPGPTLAHIRRLLSPTAAPSVPPAPHPDPPVPVRARTISAARLGRAFPGGNGSDSRTQPQP